MIHAVSLETFQLENRRSLNLPGVSCTVEEQIESLRSIAGQKAVDLIVSKKDLYDLIFFSKCMCVPLKFGSGTRIKIIEALSIGAIVLSTSKGIEGIELNKKNPPFVFNNSNF